MKILTVTLNPAYDIFYTVPGFLPNRENLATAVSVFTGGKGLNLSRALKAGGCTSTAFLLLGKNNGPAFEEAVRQSGVDAHVFYVDGRVRENLTLLTEGGPETRISEQSFSVTPALLDRVLQDLTEAIDSETVVVLAGSFPRGLTREEMLRFVGALRALTPYLVLDSKSFSAADTVALRPWLIKPNAEELEAFADHPCNTEDEILAAAEALHRRGIPHVLVSLGGDGALYCGDTGRYRITVPPITPLSTVGAGDSTVAGFLAAYVSGAALPTCLARACAFGSAACLMPGTNPPKRQTIEELAERITVTPLPE